MATNIISQEELKKLLRYDPETGIFIWRIRRGPAKQGTIAGSIDCVKGYTYIGVFYKPYPAHRLAWLYIHGVWPSNQIDHVNGNRSDNRLCNLREATNAENRQNRSIKANNSSGYLGVCWHKAAKKWASKITVNYKVKHLGYFTTPELAHKAYLKAKAELHEFQPTPR